MSRLQTIFTTQTANTTTGNFPVNGDYQVNLSGTIGGASVTFNINGSPLTDVDGNPETKTAVFNGIATFVGLLTVTISGASGTSINLTIERIGL
jgi:hypothetical protein